MVRGQVEELLTSYGKIDLLWFDGRPRGLTGDECIPLDRIRQLQPGIVVNPRLHRRGDFSTYERTLKTDKVAPELGGVLQHLDELLAPRRREPRFRAPGASCWASYVTAGRWASTTCWASAPPPTASSSPEHLREHADRGALDEARTGGRCEGTSPLPADESASVPATARGRTRYLFVLPAFKDGGKFEKDLLAPVDVTMSWKGAGKPKRVRLLGDGSALKHTWAEGELTVELPVGKRSDRPDVVAFEL